jgi:hypothetical protein
LLRRERDVAEFVFGAEGAVDGFGDVVDHEGTEDPDDITGVVVEVFREQTHEILYDGAVCGPSVSLNEGM